MNVRTIIFMIIALCSSDMMNAIIPVTIINQYKRPLKLMINGVEYATLSNPYGQVTLDEWPNDIYLLDGKSKHPNIANTINKLRQVEGKIDAATIKIEDSVIPGTFKYTATVTEKQKQEVTGGDLIRKILDANNPYSPKLKTITEHYNKSVQKSDKHPFRKVYDVANSRANFTSYTDFVKAVLAAIEAEYGCFMTPDCLKARGVTK